jgi:hypothetical protein
MVLKLTKKNLFDAYVNDLQKQKIPTKQLESAHLKTLMQFSHTRCYFLPKTSDLDILIRNGFFKTVCQFTIEDNELQDDTFINDKSDLIALAIEHTPLTPKMVEILCQMVTRPRYSWWLKERIQEILNDNESFRESFERIAFDNSIDVPQMFRRF